MRLNKAKPALGTGRRRVLAAGFASLAAGVQAQPSPARRVVLTLVTAWSSKQASMVRLLDRFAQRVFDLSGGSLVVRGQHQEQAGIAVQDLLGAVASGRIDLAHSTAQHWVGRAQAFSLFATVPFGMLPHEHYAWLRLGGGLDLWRKLAGRFGVEVLPCGNAGMQMGGWFREALVTQADLQGLRLCFAGLGGDVLKRLGAVLVPQPAGGMKAALQSGELDGAEGASPWDDLGLGLHEVCGHYYYPGVLQPGHTLELLINPEVWAGLSPAHQEVLRTACWLEMAEAQAQFSHENAGLMPRMAALPGLQLLRFPSDVVLALRKAAPAVVRDAMGGDPVAEAIFKSYSTFLQQQLRWAELSDRAHWRARYT